MDKDKALNYSSSNMQEKHPGGKGTGLSARRTRRRMERERKEQEELHAMDKPKPLEVVSDGDLSEVKKDPVWKTWLKEKDAIGEKQQKRTGNPRQQHTMMTDPGSGGRDKKGKLKPSKVTGYGFLTGGGVYDVTDSFAGGQSHGKQSTGARGYSEQYGERPQGVLWSGTTNTSLKDPKKFRTSHLPMDRHIMSKKPAKGQRSMDKLDEKGKPKHEKIYSEPDRRVAHYSDSLGDPSERGTKDTRHSDPDISGIPKDEMTRTETIIHNKIPKGGKAPKIKKAWEVWLEKKISEPDPVKDAPDPNRAVFAKDEEDYKRRKEGLGGKGGCRGVGCDKKATKKLIAWVRDLEAGSTLEKPVMSDRMHKEIINVCPDCHKRALDWQEQQKKIRENANKSSWKSWLEKKERKFKEHKCTACGETRPEEHFTNPLGRTRGVCDSCNSAFFDPSDPEDAKIISFMDQIEHKDDVDEKGDPKTTRKAYVTKPIPDSKGGRGSFQHCINANQDKRNPGGWCKQIERKIGKAKKQTRIDKPKDWWDHSKVGTKTGWDDDPMNKPSYFQAKMEEERKKKREAKEKGRTSRDRKRRQQEHVEAETSNLKDKTDYFVEEIRSNIIYHNKIFPLVGMIAGQAARGMGKVGKKIGGELLEGASEVGQGMLQGVAEEEEEQ